MKKLLLTFTVAALLSLPAISQTPSFTLHRAAVGNNATVVLHGDLNNDGFEDLITVSRAQWEDGAAGNFSSILSNGDGSYRAPVTYTFPSVSGGIPAALADFNGDGKLDLAAPVIGQNRYYLYFGNGDGTFRARVTKYLSGVNPQMVTIGAADVNHDNKTDLLLLTTSAGEQSSDLQVLFANGDGTFRTGPTTHGLPQADLSSDYPVKLLTGDFDGDGNADVALWVEGGGGFDGSYLVQVLSGNGAGNFTVTYTDSTAGGLLEAADINGDGITDLISTATLFCHDPGCNGEQPFLIAFYGATNRQMQYAQIPTNGCPAAGGGDQIAAADFNGDGIPDIAFAQDENCTSGPNTAFAILSGKGKNQFGAQTSVSSTPNGFEGLYAVRGNIDTKPDLVYTGAGSSTSPDEVATLLNQTSGNFPTCNAPNAAIGIHVCSPGSSASSPVNFAIGAAGDTAMRKAEVWVDGKKAAEQLTGAFSNYAFLNTSIPMTTGSHRVVLYGVGWDNSLDSEVFTLNVSASTSCSAPTSAGVHICSPASGSTVSSPVRISAAGKVNGTLASMQVWVDGVKTYSVAASTINTTLSVAAGSHRFAVLALNTSGQSVESAVDATVQ